MGTLTCAGTWVNLSFSFPCSLSFCFSRTGVYIKRPARQPSVRIRDQLHLRYGVDIRGITSELLTCNMAVPLSR
ncbi:hypothetical protein B0H14DRAFT_2995783 [Mycena olivaceomarginata]|nr:hypothetical protein B0H14DRAFT_2995783 [Mycena olivaceomarginata]